MPRPYEQALMMYLEDCNSHRRFVVHPARESSELLNGNWYLRNQECLIAIVTHRGNVGCKCSREAVTLATAANVAQPAPIGQANSAV